MTYAIERTIESPYTLYTTSILSFLISRAIISHVKKNGSIPFAQSAIKFNSIIYSIFSLFLCLGITSSIWSEFSANSSRSLGTLICSPASSTFDRTLRYTFHSSKIYEYVDIFNVLAAGGAVNAHFGIHHFTTMYMTYARVILHPSGWKLFAVLNTMHHAFMYSYFGGAAMFSDVLPWTGTLQLFVGIWGEIYVIRDVWGGGRECGSIRSLWANALAMGLLSTYFVLFVRDLRASGKKGEKDE